MTLRYRNVRSRWTSAAFALVLVTPAWARAQSQSGDTSAPVVPGPSTTTPPPNGAAASGTSTTPVATPPGRVPVAQTATADGKTDTTVPEAPATPVTTVGASPRASDALDSTEKHDAPKSVDSGNFQFGSYGRVQIASDLRGGTGRQANIVSHGTRIDEDSYAELELRREDTFKDNIHTKVVATLALFAPFFHFTGDLNQQIAVRNLYAQAQYGDHTVWVGSRMYRGDDIYLLDWWPLDNQNTYGGGYGYTFPGGKTSIAVHGGMTRLDNQYQYQQVQVVAPYGVGAVNVTQVDRPRLVETAKITHLMLDKNGKSGFKFIGYGEAHELSAGAYKDSLTDTQKPLPSDSGFMVGGEAAYFTGERDTFVQLFVREAHGLAAYDPLQVPTTFANDNTTSGANEFLVALGGNYERDMFGILFGGYLRFFRDAAEVPTSMQKYDEGTFVARPQVFFGEHWGLALEGSFQERRYAEALGGSNSPLTANAWRGGIIPYFSPSGRGSYKRPQFRALYAVTARNQGARELYPSQDAFSQRAVEHYAGIGVEWWFNSSSYP